MGNSQDFRSCNAAENRRATVLCMSYDAARAGIGRDNKRSKHVLEIAHRGLRLAKTWVDCSNILRLDGQLWLMPHRPQTAS